MESKILEIIDQEKQVKLQKWVSCARNKADWLDPLTDNEDEVLGKNKYIFEKIFEIEQTY